MKSLLLVLSLMIFSSIGFAETYQCDVTPGFPGAPSYLIVIGKMPSGSSKTPAVILQRQMSTGSPEWSLVFGNATAGRAPDGGPLSISGIDNTKVDWSKPQLQKECFYIHKASYFIRLRESSQGTTGEISIGQQIEFNPHHVGYCPFLTPPGIQHYQLACQEF